MTHVQAVMWTGAGAALAVALLAGWRERVRRLRINLDVVGLVDWPTVQLLALVAAALCALLAVQLQ